MKFKRAYESPKKSVFLLGPRGTGKSTFIRDFGKPDLSIDLLRHSTYRALSLNPSSLENLTGHLKPGQTVLIDEIQKLPELLDEVHRLIENRRLVFFLTGSSARKLKRAGANLLAGRALSRKMYPLSCYEIGNIKDVQSLIYSGGLPSAVTSTDPDSTNDFLFTYVEAYLKEEIFQEGITRNLEEFSKFIEVAARYHGQILNFENIAREVGVSGDTVKAWFQVLQDTLVGYLIQPYSLRLFSRESKHPRFYFFDCGVARAAEAILDFSEHPERQGFYFETLVLNELKTYFEVRKKPYKIFYYSVPSMGDVDFIIEVRRKSMSSHQQFVAIEVKYTKTWKSSYEKVVAGIREGRPKQLLKSLGVYLGKEHLTNDNISVFPMADFVENLWADKVFA